MVGDLLDRERELAKLHALIEAVREGSGGLLLVEGPAGIGKTALLGEARELAREAGVVVMAASGGEMEREFPYGVVRQLFEPGSGDCWCRERKRRDKPAWSRRWKFSTSKE